MFTTTPERFGSLYNEQIYRFESSSERDITLKIEDAESGDLLGVKKFYSTTTADINVSPIVKQNVMPAIGPYEDGFFAIKRQGFAKVQLTECETGEKSEPQTLLLSEDNSGYAIISSICMEGPIANHEDEIALISAFAPQSRALSIGESDTLLFAVPAGAEVQMVVEQYAYDVDEPVATKSYRTIVEEPGFAAFNLVARPYLDQLKHIMEPQLDTIQLKLQLVSQDVEGVERLRDCVTFDYQIIDTPHSAVRIAWVSHKGSIEHYTFPVVKQKSISESHITTMTLCSAYETNRVRETLSQIVKSPRLWVVTTMPDDPEAEDMMIEGAVTQSYTRAELLDKRLLATPETALSTIEIEVAYNA